MMFARALAFRMIQDEIVPEWNESYDQGTPPRGAQRYLLVNARLTSDCVALYDYAGGGFSANSAYRSFYVQVLSKAYEGAGDQLESIMQYLMTLTGKTIENLKILNVDCIGDAYFFGQEDTAMVYASNFEFKVQVLKEGVEE